MQVYKWLAFEPFIALSALSLGIVIVTELVMMVGNLLSKVLDVNFAYVCEGK